MRNIEPITRKDKKCGHDFGEVFQRKGAKRNKTKRGGGNKGFFFDMNTGKSLLATIYGD